MSAARFIENNLWLSDSGVWQLSGHDAFDYSDGKESEKYLEKVLGSARDLSTRSVELEKWIKDWPSEYHLSRKRAQLLSGFSFDKNKNVLEVGCGCGAITRFLGENFQQVISVEGSLTRAKLARMRARDMDNVSVVCAPFQEIRFNEEFDIIFCIGVFEYSGSFISGEDPYYEALKFFSRILAPDGMLVLAIENQFGLKYFTGAREDHLGERYEGLEGYHRPRQKVRTFGKVELENRVRRHFKEVEFYYPYPDYKLPDCVLSSSFVGSGKAAELISQIHARDYSGTLQRSWDDAAVALELGRNQMLEFFSNSFVVVAGKEDLDSARFEQQGIIFSPARVEALSTETRIVGDTLNDLKAIKVLADKSGAAETSKLRLVANESEWVDSLSLQTSLFLKSRRRDASLENIFAICRPFLKRLSADAIHSGQGLLLGGEHIDSIFSNAYMHDGIIKLIDREYVWKERIPLNAVVIRAIYNFLIKLDDEFPIAAALEDRSGRRLITEIAKTLGVALSSSDFEQFIALECELQCQIFGTRKSRQSIYLHWFLIDRSSLGVFVCFRNRFTNVSQRGVSLLKRVFKRLK